MALALHQHGKSRVRLGRVWREGNVHHMVEWTVHAMLESPMEHAFLFGNNAGMTPTDTQKNMVYVVAKKLSQRCSAEEYAIALAQQFVNAYPLVTKAKIKVEEKPWQRVNIQQTPHNHGFVAQGEIRVCNVSYDKKGSLQVEGGFKELPVLKTTQSGYEGYLKDQYTTLAESTDRIMATMVTAIWKYSGPVSDYNKAYSTAKEAILGTFFGPPKEGVYSPGVQTTLYNMASAVIDKVPEIDSVYMNLPNLHFLPCNPVGSTFEKDVYIATSEPHGNIEAVVTRQGRQPHCRL